MPFVLLWMIWIFMLIGGVDLGCSIIRLIILASPFVMSNWVLSSVQLIVNHMWPSWLLPLLQGNWSSIGQPPTVVEQSVDNGDPGLAENLISVEDYLDQYPAMMVHPTYHFQIPTREGLNLWQGFLNIVLNAYEGNESYAGTFTEEHLMMSGSECRIEMEPTYPATFENLLLDLAQLATLLIVYFGTPNLLPPRCIQEVYSAMTTPRLGAVPAPSAQQLEIFLKFMRNLPGLKPVRKNNTFLSKVFQARRGMGTIPKATVDAAIAQVVVATNWMYTIHGLGYVILTRTVNYRKYNPHNTVPVYGQGAEEFFRFLRNVFEHGGDLDDNGREMVWDMEDLDYIVAEFFSDKMAELVWHLVMGVDMTGRLSHAWDDYQ
uniref:Uncharacterized protein n=1 Tax=Avena sativa TaxID=4498 RepID=A0ACD5V0T6_AVESA